MFTLYSALKDTCRKFGDRPAFCEGRDVLTYSGLLERVETTAAALIALGVRKGDRVAIWAPNSGQVIEISSAIGIIGGVLVPLNTRLTATEAIKLVDASRASFLFSAGLFRERHYARELLDASPSDLQHTPCVILNGDHDRFLSWNDFIAGAGDISIERLAEATSLVAPEDPADILFTSGTTGQPKGICTNHYQNVRAFGDWCHLVGLRHTDRYLMISPFSHNFGYKGGWLAAIISGAAMYPVAVFDPMETLKLIDQESISVLTGAPTLFQTLEGYLAENAVCIDSLRLAVTGSTSVPEKLVHMLMDRFSFERVVSGYGLTETGVTTLTRAEDDIETICSTVGKPLPGVELRIVDENGDSCAVGDRGEVWIKGYTIPSGYLNDVEATTAAFTDDGWFKTGDIGCLDDRGYLRITGRIKDIYISGGFNCYPAEIENAVTLHPKIKACGVIGVPDDHLGEVGCAFVVVEPGFPLSVEAINAWCVERLAKYKRPRVIRFVNQLPLTTNGKIDKPMLRALAQESAVTGFIASNNT